MARRHGPNGDDLTFMSLKDINMAQKVYVNSQHYENLFLSIMDLSGDYFAHLAVFMKILLSVTGSYCHNLQQASVPPTQNRAQAHKNDEKKAR